MRQLLVKALRENTNITDEVGDRIYQSSTLGVGTVPQTPKRPYIMYNELPSVPYPEVRKTSRAAARRFQVFVYDDRGSFVRIERILALVRETVLQLVATTSPSGARCTDVEWLGKSGDFTDIQRGENVKFGTIRFTSSEN